MPLEVVAREPWTLRIGREVYASRPVSGEGVRALHRAMAAVTVPKALERALFSFWRLAFPIRPANWWRGDPARQLARLPIATLALLLADLLKVPEPPTPAEPEPEGDEFDRFVSPLYAKPEDQPGAKVSFVHIADLVEQAMGAQFWHDPNRYQTAGGTVDGFVPYHQVWTAWRTLEASRAAQRLDMARAMSLLRLERHQARAAIDQEQQLAFGRHG